MKILTKEIETQLRKNAANPNKDQMKPVLKLFNPVGAGTWLLTELDKDNVLFGLCDLGMGFPELGYVSLDELTSIRLRGGLKIERDMYFVAKKTLEEYAADAAENGYINA